MASEIKKIFASGLSFGQYRDNMSTHVDAFRSHYERLAFVPKEERDKAPVATANILVLTEDYCIDSVLNVPLIARLVEASPGSELRLAKREAHLDVAARFPGRGGVNRLPTAIFLDQCGTVLGFWSERSKKDHQWMTDFLARDPMPELELNGGQPTPLLAQWMARRFAAQRSFFETESWKSVRDELHSFVKEALAQCPAVDLMDFTPRAPPMGEVIDMILTAGCR
jgi:hypothetical protein